MTAPDAGPLAHLGLGNPVLAAPMAGGPSTPGLVAAAAQAESLGFLAAGYKTADQLASQLRETSASTAVFGVNLFAPNPVPVDPDSYRSYALAIQKEGERYGLNLNALPPREDDDGWEEKVSLLLAEPVPLVSFTFGVPDASVVQALRRVGSVVAQTVTSPSEAAEAASAGVDLLFVQGHEAGAHYGTLSPEAPPAPVGLPTLVRQVRACCDLQIVAAGGLAERAAVREVLHAGASAVMVGTFLLRTDESGASPTYKAALGERRNSTTVVTRAFTGRPARGLRNLFIDRYDSVAPLGYPAVHYLTSPLRRAAAEAGNADLLNLWAGTGHAFAPTGPASAALTELGSSI